MLTGRSGNEALFHPVLTTSPINPGKNGFDKLLLIQTVPTIFSRTVPKILMV